MRKKIDKHNRGEYEVNQGRGLRGGRKLITQVKPVIKKRKIKKSERQ